MEISETASLAVPAALGSGSVPFGGLALLTVGRCEDD